MVFSSYISGSGDVILVISIADWCLRGNKNCLDHNYSFSFYIEDEYVSRSKYKYRDRLAMTNRNMCIVPF